MTQFKLTGFRFYKLQWIAEKAPLQIIDRYKHQQEEKLVFSRMNYWSMCKKLKKVMEACGIEKQISYHCGRHSFATIALTNGMPIESVIYD